MVSVQTAAFGSWKSPITAELLVADAVRLSNPTSDGDAIYWVEGRPQESGRSVLVQRDREGNVRDALPEGFGVLTLAHEYGGLCYAVRDGVVYFSNFEDQRIYRLAPGSAPTPSRRTRPVLDPTYSGAAV